VFDGKVMGVIVVATQHDKLLKKNKQFECSTSPFYDKIPAGIRRYYVKSSTVSAEFISLTLSKPDVNLK
jgi:hypothetical protein